MPHVNSNFFGQFTPEPADLVHFQRGLPGFEDQHYFAAVTVPGQAPIIYLQSTTRPDLCLITLPARVFLESYRLELAPDEMDTLDICGPSQPEIGSQVACQVIITVDENREPCANLAAPIVINLANRSGVQSFQSHPGYSFRHPVSEVTGSTRCS